MSNEIPSDPAPAAKLAWTTPQIEPIGQMDDVMSGGAQPPYDGTSPSLAAS